MSWASSSVYEWGLARGRNLFSLTRFHEFELSLVQEFELFQEFSLFQEFCETHKIREFGVP